MHQNYNQRHRRTKTNTNEEKQIGENKRNTNQHKSPQNIQKKIRDPEGTKRRTSTNAKTQRPQNPENSEQRTQRAISKKEESLEDQLQINKNHKESNSTNYYKKQRLNTQYDTEDIIFDSDQKIYSKFQLSTHVKKIIGDIQFLKPKTITQSKKELYLDELESELYRLEKIRQEDEDHGTDNDNEAMLRAMIQILNQLEPIHPKKQANDQVTSTTSKEKRVISRVVSPSRFSKGGHPDDTQSINKKIKQLQLKNRQLQRKSINENTLLEKLQEINKKIEENQSWRQNLIALRSSENFKNKSLGLIIYSLLFKLQNLSNNQQNLHKSIKTLLDVISKPHINRNRKKVQIQKLMSKIGIVDDDLIEGFTHLSLYDRSHEDQQTKPSTEQKKFAQGQSEKIKEMEKQILLLRKENSNHKEKERIDGKMIQQLGKLQNQMKNQLESLRVEAMEKQTEWIRKQQLLRETIDLGEKYRTPMRKQSSSSIMMNNQNFVKQTLSNPVEANSAQLESMKKSFQQISENISQTLSVMYENVQEDTGIFRLRKKNSKEDLFSDLASPYAKAPQHVKDLFIREQFRKLSIKELDESYLPRKKGSTNMCTKILRPGDRFYVCEECSLNSDEAYRVFCPDCWLQAKHEGHSFTSGTLREFPGRVSIVPFIICDCGKKEHLKQQFFCPNHQSNATFPDIQPEEQIADKFNELMEPLIYIALYLIRNKHKSDYSNNKPHEELIDKIKIYLSQLCHRSIYYIRLTTQLLRKQIIDENNTKINLLEYIIRQKINMEILFLTMLADNKFKEKLARTVIEYKRNQFDVINYQMIVDCGLTGRLADDGLFFGDSFSSKYYNNAKLPLGNKTFHKYLRYKLETDPKFPKIFTKMLQDEIFPIPTNKDLYMLNELQLVKFAIQQFFKAYQTPVSKSQICDENLNDQQQPKIFELKNNSDSKNYCAGILYLLSCYLKHKSQKFEGICGIKQLVCKQIGVEVEQYKRFLRVGVSNVKGLASDSYNKQQWLLIPLLKMVSEHLDQEPIESTQLLSTFWNNFLKLTDKQHRDRRTNIVLLDRIFNLISLIVHYKNYSKIYLNQPEFKNDQEREIWFKSYLYENKIINRSELLKFRAKGELNFYSAKQILQDLCKFNEDQQEFVYSHEDQYENYLLRFRMRDYSERDKLQNLYNCRFSIDEHVIYHDGFQKECFKLIFGCEKATGAMCKKFMDFIQLTKKNNISQQILKQYQFGYYFVLLLVCMDKLTEERNQTIKQCLREIKQNKQSLELVDSLTTNRSVYTLLCLKQSEIQQGQEMIKKESESQKQEPVQRQSLLKVESQKIEEDEEDHVREVRKKSLQKKMQKYAKIKQKRQKILKNSPQQFEQEGGAEENQCLICHEKGTKIKKLVYLAELNNKTVSSSFHGKDNKTSLLIDSCFHAVHVQCFMKIIQQQRFEYACPLCSQVRNIILPQKIQDNRSLVQCQNSINAFYVTKMKMMNFNGILPILFKHLIESLGLHSLVSVYLEDAEKNRRQKNEKYAYLLLEHVFSISSPQKKKQFEIFYEEFVQQIYKCENFTIRDLQLLIAQILFNRLTQGKIQYDRSRINHLKKILVKDQFETVQRSLKDFLGENNDAIGNIEADDPQIKNGQEQIQKVSLSFHVKMPPLNVALLASFGEKKCMVCKVADKTVICLLCGKQLCNTSNCPGFEEHQAYHNSNLLCLMIKEAVVTIYRMRGGITMKITAPLYYNFLMIPYHSRRSGEKPEEFELRSEQYEKIIAFFFMP